MTIDSEQIKVLLGIATIFLSMLGLGWRFLKLERFMREHELAEQAEQRRNCADHGLIFDALKIPRGAVSDARARAGVAGEKPHE